jgi:hypothetical protein
MGLCLVAATVTVTTFEARRTTVQLGNLATPDLAHLNTGQGCPSPSPQQLRGLMGDEQGTRHPVVARVMLVGDSTACTMLPGLQAVGHPAGVQVENAAVVGCGVVAGEIAAQNFIGDTTIDASTRFCQRRANAAEAKDLRSGTPNVVLWSSSWERNSLVVGTGDHQKVVAPGSSQWYTVLRQRMEARVQDFTSLGATVIMVTQPPFVDLGKTSGPTAQDEQFERLNNFLTDFAAHTPHVRVVDLSARVCPSGPPCPILVNGLWLRGDGAHYGPDGSLWVARWLMPQLGIPALDTPMNSMPVMTVQGTPNGSVFTGTHALATTASFNVGVARVKFRVTGGTLRHAVVGTAESSGAFWGWLWNTSEVPNGTYEVRSIAYDSAGASSVSKAITVRVVNSGKA